MKSSHGASGGNSTPSSVERNGTLLSRPTFAVPSVPIRSRRTS